MSFTQNDGGGTIWAELAGMPTGLRIDTNGSEKMRITSAGNVGIGTTSPAAWNSGKVLHIHNPSGNSSELHLTDNGSGAASGDGSVIHHNSTNLYIQNHEAGNLQFYNNGSERLRIANDGVIQNSTIDSSTSSALKISNNAGSGNFTYGMTIEDDSSNTGFILFAQSDGTAVGSITRSGTSTVYATSSDYRLKEDFKDFNALEIASKIKMYDFKWNSNNTRDYGVIAHELQEVFPQAVVGEKDGENMQGVDYSKLVPILLKSIQELEARVKELEKEI